MAWGGMNVPALCLFVWRALFGMVALVGGLLVGSVLAVLYGLGEFVAVYYGLRNLREAVAVDRRVVAWVVPVAYAAGCVVLPVGSSVGLSWFVVVLSGATLVAAIWCRLTLGAAVSLGLPTWVDVVTTGPYGVVRHPAMALALLSRVWFVVGHFCWLNVVVSLMWAVVVVFSVVVEEEWLVKWASWRRYAAGVRWRLVPGVW